jgi:hypothetical protein
MARYIHICKTFAIAAVMSLQQQRGGSQGSIVGHCRASMLEKGLYAPFQSNTSCKHEKDPPIAVHDVIANKDGYSYRRQWIRISREVYFRVGKDQCHGIQEGGYCDGTG